MPKPNVTVKFDAAETKAAFARAAIKKLGWCGLGVFNATIANPSSPQIYEVAVEILEKEILDELQVEAEAVIGDTLVGAVTRKVTHNNGVVDGAIVEFTFNKPK